MQRHRLARLLAAATFGSLLMPGCDSGPPKTVPVIGRVTLDGGKWPRHGMIYFAPVEPAAGYSRRAGQADFDTTGHFEAYSFEKGDGLVPGKYVVSIECWEQPPTMSAPGRSAVPAKYQTGSTSGLTLEVAPLRGERVEPTFDVVSAGAE